MKDLRILIFSTVKLDADDSPHSSTLAIRLIAYNNSSILNLDTQAFMNSPKHILYLQMLDQLLSFPLNW